MAYQQAAPFVRFLYRQARYYALMGIALSLLAAHPAQAAEPDTRKLYITWPGCLNLQHARVGVADAAGDLNQILMIDGPANMLATTTIIEKLKFLEASILQLMQSESMYLGVERMETQARIKKDMDDLYRSFANYDHASAVHTLQSIISENEKLFNMRMDEPNPPDLPPNQACLGGLSKQEIGLWASTLDILNGPKPQNRPPPKDGINPSSEKQL